MGKWNYLLLVLLATSSFAQTPEEQDIPYREPSLIYAIQGRTDFASRRITASAEIEYHNAGDTTVESLLFELPEDVDTQGRGKRFSIDSVLLNGVPQDIGPLILGKRFLQIPVRLAPQERAHLLIPFVKDFSDNRARGQYIDGLHIQAWYPKVVSAAAEDDTGATPGRTVPLVATYRVGLQTDTAFLLIGPGELRNDREHFGYLPDRGDTVLNDIVNNTLGDQRPARKGQFQWIARNIQSFDIVCLQRPTIDRIVAGPAKLTLYYSAQATRFRRELNHATRELSRFYQVWLGTPSNPQNSVVAAGIRQGGEYDYADLGLILLPLESRRESVIRASLAVQLAQQYFPASFETDSVGGLPWSEGAAIFAATQALYSLYGSRGYEMMEEYGGYRFPLPRIGQPTSRQSPFAFMETIRAPRFRWDGDDSIRYEALFVVPSALQALRPITGADRLWAALRHFSSQSRHNLASPDQFTSLMSEYLGAPVNQLLFGQWQDYHRRFDWSVDGVKAESTYTGALVTGTIERDALRGHPVEVGIIMSTGDTLSKSVTPTEADTRKFLHFQLEIIGKPVAVIVDPYHFLPDVNRDNNVYHLTRGPFRGGPKVDEFPAFRRIARGE